MAHQVCFSIMSSCVYIPDLDNVVCFLGTDREPIDDIRVILDDFLEHGGDGVAYKGQAGLGLENAETICTAIDIVTVLPEGWYIAAHEEEHAVAQCIYLER